MTQRVIAGRRNNGNYGLFVSAPAADVDTAADIDLMFSTQYGHAALVHQSGIVMLSGTTQSSAVTFPALPYIPLVICGYYDSVNGRYYYAQMEIAAWAGGTWGGQTFTAFGPNVTVTASDVKFQCNQNHGTDWGVKYHIIRVPGGS